MAAVVEVGKSFFVMNTQVNAMVCVSPMHIADAYAGLDEVQQFFCRAERTLSRFLPTSELSRLNASAGRPFQASSQLFDVVSAALEAAKNTGGLFDPTVLPNLFAAGYDRTFNKIKKAGFEIPTGFKNRFSWHDVRLDCNNCLIYLPPGCGLDLGGAGKGWAVDQIRRILDRFSGFVVDAGGDIVVEATQGDGKPWTIGIADPFDNQKDLMAIDMTGGAICTSSTLRRRWHAGNSVRHHIIDPRTGEPSQSGVVAATVTASSALRAETITKAAIILGAEKGMEFIRQSAGVEGLLVTEDHEVLCSPGIKEKQYVA